MAYHVRRSHLGARGTRAGRAMAGCAMGGGPLDVIRGAWLQDLVPQLNRFVGAGLAAPVTEIDATTAPIILALYQDRLAAGVQDAGSVAASQAVTAAYADPLPFLVKNRTTVLAALAYLADQKGLPPAKEVVGGGADWTTYAIPAGIAVAVLWFLFGGKR